jgi:hypothetical protein
MATKIPAIIRVRRGTADEWNNANPVLQEGEIGYITSGDNAGKLKVGDGVNTWNNLPLTIGDTHWGEIGGLLANQTDLQDEFDKTNDLILDLETIINGWIGRGGYLTPYDFGTSTPAQSDITSQAMAEISGITDPSDIFNGTKIKNLFDGHVWILTNTPDTNPAVFEWTDQGIGDIAQFTENVGGYIVGSSDSDGIGYVKATPEGKGVVTGLVEMNSLLTMGPPDYAQAQVINGTSYTADRPVWFSIKVATNLNVRVNGFRIVQNNPNGVGLIIPLKSGDVVTGFANDGGTFAIPPVLNPPAYLESMPLLDYSTVEQDTGRKWIDGKPIYQKTINHTSNIASESWTTLFSAPVGTISIIRAITQSENVGGSKVCVPLIINLNGTNVQAYIAGNGFGVANWNTTIWYTK